MCSIKGCWLALAFAFLGTLPAAAGDIHADSRIATPSETYATVARYGSLPGGGHYHSRASHIRSAEAEHFAHRYGSVPGGVILEGSAPSVGPVTNAGYDATSGSIVLDGRLKFKAPLSTVQLSALARAIADDDRIGISITDDDVIAYGDVDVDSVLARDLALADTFLADLILPPREWTDGYRMADGYQPQEADSDRNFIVLFRFQDFAFSQAANVLTPSAAKVDILVVPVSEQKAEDGGYLADIEALNSGVASPAIEANARHVGDHIGYYLQERIAARALAYGQAAALFRHLKAQHIDLDKLADAIDSAAPATASANGDSSAQTAWVSLKDAWLAYLEEIKAAGDYGHWAKLQTTALQPDAASQVSPAASTPDAPR